MFDDNGNYYDESDIVPNYAVITTIPKPNIVKKSTYNPIKPARIVSNGYLATKFGISRPTLDKKIHEFGKYNPKDIGSVIDFVRWLE
jgi:hypothetical protein